MIYLIKLEEKKGEKTIRMRRKSQEKRFGEDQERWGELLLDFSSESLRVGKVLGS